MDQKDNSQQSQVTVKKFSLAIRRNVLPMRAFKRLGRCLGRLWDIQPWKLTGSLTGKGAERPAVVALALSFVGFVELVDLWRSLPS